MRNHYLEGDQIKDKVTWGENQTQTHRYFPICCTGSKERDPKYTIITIVLNWLTNNLLCKLPVLKHLKLNKRNTWKHWVEFKQLNGATIIVAKGGKVFGAYHRGQAKVTNPDACLCDQHFSPATS